MRTKDEGLILSLTKGGRYVTLPSLVDALLIHVSVSCPTPLPQPFTPLRSSCVQTHETASNMVLALVGESKLPRRSFLKLTGASLVAAAASGFLSRSVFGQSSVGVSLGSGDIGVLNYAYALEQLEALFYTKVASSFYRGINSNERAILSEIRDHEIAHRTFFKKTLGSAGIPALEFDFSSVDFSSRASVLRTASTFEDTGVGAYNGAGQLLRDPNHLLAAGRIVSVEARHAAILRDLLAPRSAAFAGDDMVDLFGLGAVERPSAVLRKVAPYIRTTINADGLPRV